MDANFLDARAANDSASGGDDDSVSGNLGDDEIDGQQGGNDILSGGPGN